jgi:hypothetical protein
MDLTTAKGQEEIQRALAEGVRDANSNLKSSAESAGNMCVVNIAIVLCTVYQAVVRVW